MVMIKNRRNIMMIMVTMRGERRGGMVMIKRIITMRIIMMFMVTVRWSGINREER